MDSLFVCPRCGNDDPRYVGYIAQKPYCRRCIAFQGQEVTEADLSKPADTDLRLDYDLSPEQKALSEQVINHYQKGEHVLIHAVTGAGKTEIVYAVMQQAIRAGHKVGLAIPRRDVVMELAVRLKGAFPQLRITSVYGGHHDELEGDIVILTTHQLYRYVAYFDLLVIDEYDAFPFKDDPVLEAFAKRSLQGVLVAMSATPTRLMIERFEAPGHHILHLWTRYHGQPLPIPKLVIRSLLFRFEQLLGYITRYKKEQKPLLIFVPTIALGEKLFFAVGLFAKGGGLVHSKRVDRTEIITAFREGKLDYLISTSVLERGITLVNLQVVVYEAHHPLFDEGTLLQMAGRVGRKARAPNGDVIFLGRRKTSAMQKAVITINHANSYL